MSSPCISRRRSPSVRERSHALRTSGRSPAGKADLVAGQASSRLPTDWVRPSTAGIWPGAVERLGQDIHSRSATPQPLVAMGAQ
ncbi:Hypothetical predicted protein, partial [Pelobates cultripes]